MGSIKDRVAIVGMGCTKFGELWDKSDFDLTVDACWEAFDDAGIGPNDIEAAWVGTAFSPMTGRRLAEALKLDYLPVTRIENLCASGGDAFRNACYAVAAGVYDVVLACGVEKLKDSGAAFFGAPDEPPYGTKVDAIGVHTPPTLFALLATSYFHTYGLSYEEGKRLLSQIAVKNHYNGTLNPKAHLQREITLEQAMNAPMVAYPLGLFDCCSVTDGAAAAIITRAENAKAFRSDQVLVKGLGLCAGGRQGLLGTDYNFTHLEEGMRASRIAYAEAGITNPRQEIDLAMMHDCFTIAELILYEDLGFSPRGGAKEDIEAGTFTLKGELPVNTDGGLKSFGHPIGATGVRMIYEVYKQLQGKAGPRQLSKADIGLTQNQGGYPGSMVGIVCLLGRPD